VLSPLAGTLVLKPFDDGWPAVAFVSSELEVGETAFARLTSNPGLGHGETLGEFAGSEEALAHVDRASYRRVRRL
jgi:hypothetical protein